MSKEEQIHVIIPEGGTNNYITGFKNALGGIETENSLLLKNDPVNLKLNYYTIEGVEFVYVDLSTKKPLLITRTPDNNPDLLHLNIIKEDVIKRKIDNKDLLNDANNQGNIFLYNGLFPVEGEFQAYSRIQYIGYKINLSLMGPIYEGLQEILKKLFDKNESLAYFASLSPENEKLISDLFAYSDISKGKVPLITARALEILTNIVLSFNKEVEKDELAGLHIEDYNLINAIKKKILDNLESSFTIEELSKEFGISATKLKKDFKHLNGTSIYKFYNTARMDEAYRRLKSGDYSVSEVGYDMGYSSLSKFSSMFKKIKGILPNEVETVK